MHKTSAWPLAEAYAALIVYASLYPFSGWRDQGISPSMTSINATARPRSFHIGVAAIVTAQNPC